MSKTLFFSNGFASVFAVEGYERGFIVLSSEQQKTLANLITSVDTIIQSVKETRDLEAKAMEFHCGNSFRPLYFAPSLIEDDIDDDLYNEIEKLGDEKDYFWLDGVAAMSSGDYLSFHGKVKQPYTCDLIIRDNSLIWRATQEGDGEYIESIPCRLA